MSAAAGSPFTMKAFFTVLGLCLSFNDCNGSNPYASIIEDNTKRSLRTKQNGALDTHREAAYFDTTVIRKSGRTYLDTLKIEFRSDRLTEGSDRTSSYGLVVLNSEVKADKVQPEATQFETTITNLTSRTVHGFETFKCDINQDMQDSPRECSPFYELKANTFRVVVDEKGEITHLNDRDSASMGAQRAAVQSIEQTERLLQLIPSGAPISPGSRRPISKFFPDELGYFSGMVTLDGYYNFHGSDCALFAITGDLQINLDQLLAKFNMMGHNRVVVRSAKYDARVLWDNAEGLIRSSTATMTTELEMENGFMERSSRIVFEIEETIHLSSSVKG